MPDAVRTARSIPAMLLARATETPDRPAFLVPAPSGPGWITLIWANVLAQVRAVASGLRELGLASEDRCAILSSTRVDWILADLGILGAGGATTTIYPSNTAEECRFIIADSGARFAFAENDEQVAKLSVVRKDLPTLTHVITFDGKASADGWVIPWKDFLERGRAADARDPGAFERIVAGVAPTSLATLVYTSGTTGQPKGVELTQDCWVYEGEAIDALGLLTPDDVQYLWLPLSHVFGKVLEAAQLRIGFPTAIDGRIDKLVENLAQVRPTFVCAVPRIFEKVHNKIVAGGTSSGGVKAALFEWAFRIGNRAARLEREGRSVPLVLGAQRALATRLVFQKVRKLFGDRLRFFVSGSAPLSREMAEFFHAAGILILEGYGLTESSAASFINLPGKTRFGTVGLPLPGTEVKIAPEDGEILLHGRGIMRGYKGLPEETSAALTQDRWLRTGDIGEVDAEGFLRITDRKKDLIKTSGGKYVAPQFLEGKLKAISPWIDQVLVHGNNRNFCTALVTLDEEAIRKWARENGADASLPVLAKDDRVRALLKPAFDQLNAELPSYSTIKKFAVLPASLTVEAGELTPSLKVKRKVVEQKYKALLDGFYAGAV
ncbi:MAG TPA: long-chain fatty acid--CoA ligase [Myxococcales bacterium]|nr:long-chain fatty acid--CoA ligase [Myxococcales bacterium]